MNELKKSYEMKQTLVILILIKIGRCNRQQQIYRNYDVKYTN